MIGAAVASSPRAARERVSQIVLVVAAAGPVPSAPTSVSVSGSTSGSKTINAVAPSTLYDGTAISGAPIVSFTAKAYQIVAGVIGALRGTATGSSLPLTITGLPAEDMVAIVTATNANGPSEESLPSDQWTGT